MGELLLHRSQGPCVRPPRVAMPPPAPPPVTHPLVGRRSLSYSCRPHASPLFPVDAPDRHHPPPARTACALLCTGEARGAPLRRRAPMPPLGDCPVHPPSGQGRIRQDPARPVVERVDLGLIRQEMCLILRENACATSGRATPGDPRGVGEHWVSSQGPRQAMRLFCFALCACSVLFEGFGLAALGWPTCDTP